MSLPLLPSTVLADVARRFRLLGEPVRLELLNMLHVHGELPVTDLVEASGQSQANVSKHLGLLAAEGMVSRRKDGLFVYYKIADPTLAAICLLVCSKLQQEERAGTTSSEQDLESAINQ